MLEQTEPGALAVSARVARSEYAGRDRVGADTLLVAFVALAAAGLVVVVAHSFKQDAWLGLVAGRLIWSSGLPHHNTLTAIAAGAPWIDQQWLSHLSIYAAYRLGGISLLVLIDAALMIAGIGGAALGARRLGASPRAALVALAATLPLALVATNVRAEAFAFPCFAATLFLLAADSRRPSARVLLCLPLLALWGNLHGSALLGAGLVSLRGLTLVWERRSPMRHSLNAWARPLALIAAPACLLITPYGASIVSYYRSTVFSGAFGHLVTEWQPLTHSPALAVYVFGLLGLVGLALWRSARRPTPWEGAALLILFAGAFDAMRNVIWLEIGIVLLVAPYAGAARAGRAGSRPRRGFPARRRHVGVLVALGSCAAVAVAAVSMASSSRPQWERDYPVAAASAVERIAQADPGIHVVADLPFADWLLWRDPRLAGHIAYDSRLEVMSGGQLARLHRFALGRPSALVRGYRLVVVDPTRTSALEPGVLAAFLREPGSRVVYRDAAVVVLLRRESASA